jgi:hypothetical protein
MNKEIQAIIEKLMTPHPDFWRIDGSLTALLEVLNIVSLVPSINYKILKFGRVPDIQADSYDEALWINAIKTFAHGEFFL